MRSIRSLTCGAPGRAALSAAALATIILTAAGQLNALIAAAFYTAMWGTVFLLSFLVLGILGAGALDGAEAVKSASKEGDHG